MKKHISPENPRPLLILGHTVNAAELALRRILHAKERGQPLVVLDYQGNLASLLTDRNKGNLEKGPMLWCDLANRRRPVALFRFERSAGMKLALRGFLDRLVRYVGAPVSGGTLDVVVDLAYRLADKGNVGLAALVGSLRRPEMAQPLRRDPALAGELDALIDVLDWIMRFPAVWSLSEGNNRVDIHRALKLGGTIWLEIPSAHLERLEHLIVSWAHRA